MLCNITHKNNHKIKKKRNDHEKALPGVQNM